MPIVQLIVILLVFGIVVWLINGVIPIDPMIRRIIIILMTLLVIIWLLGAVGLLNYRIG